MKMDISRIEVGGFRNILSNALDLESITALLATNSYGKSNLMDAIDYGFKFIKADTKGKRRLMMSSENSPLNSEGQLVEYTFSINCNLQTRNVEYCVKYGFVFSWGDDDRRGSIVSEKLEIKQNKKGKKYSLYVSRDGGKARYKTSESGRCDKSIRIEENALVLNKLSAFDELFYIDIIRSLNNVEFFKVEFFDAAPSYRPNPIIYRDFDDLDLVVIQSIPKVFTILQKEYPEKYDLLINAYQHLFPNFESIVAQEVKYDVFHETGCELDPDSPIQFSDLVHVMSVYDNNLTKPISFEALSDGAKRVLLTLTYAVLADIKGLSLLAIEEPENCIHPKLLQDYVNILSQLVENCKIILSSHSPYLVQYINPKGIYVGMPNSKGHALFRPIKASKISVLTRAASEDDESVGTYLFNLLSQDDDDNITLQSYFGG